jgi:hypothetical protein
MKTFKEFISIEEEVPASNIAHSGATQIAKYDPIMKFKVFRRKPKKHKK